MPTKPSDRIEKPELVLLEGRFHVPEELSVRFTKTTEPVKTYGNNPTNFKQRAKTSQYEVEMSTKREPMLRVEAVNGVEWVDFRLFTEERKIILEDPVVSRIEQSFGGDNWQLQIVGSGARAKKYV